MRVIRLCLLAMGAVIFAVSVHMHILTGNAGDKNWLLLAAREWLEGKRLYVDIFEVNPPLILWVYALAVWMSMHFPHIGDGQALASMGLMLTAGITALSYLLIRRHPHLGAHTTRRLQFLALLAFVFVVYTPDNYFFDRDYILLACTFPYALRFLPGLSAARFPFALRIAVGLVAALGFCIKPYSVVIFLGIQAASVLRTRSWAILYSVENILIYALGAVYLACVWEITPEYVTTVTPMILATYSAYKSSGLIYLIAAFVLYGVTLADFRPRYASPLKSDIYYLLCLCGTYLVYALCNNGWGYTYHPLMVMGLILTLWVMWDHNDLKEKQELLALPVKTFVFGARACAINLACNFAFALTSIFAFFSVPSCETNPECNKYSLLMNEIKTHRFRSFGVMSTDYHKWAQIGRASGARWDTRFMCLWMLEKFTVSNADFRVRHQWILNYVDRGYADDLSARKPDAVFVEAGYKMKLPEFFASSREFEEAWSHYRLLHRLELCRKTQTPGRMPDCKYDVYERIPSSQ